MTAKKRARPFGVAAMAEFTIEEILQATGGRLLQKGEAAAVTGVSTDTRTLSKGALYIPLIGENFDGHAFLGKAAEAGAGVVLMSDVARSEGLPASVSAIAVPDTLQALEDLARFHRSRFDIPVVAVTGSSGKTTTKDMLTAILETTFSVCSTKKNHNNEIGLSETILSLNAGHEVLVTEMGMRGLGQIAELADVARPTMGLVTCVGTAHIGILGSQENIARAKGELIEALPKDGVAILNADDPYVSAMHSLFAGRSLYYGVETRRDVYATDISFGASGTTYTCHVGETSFPVTLRLLGIHNVYDALAATAVAVSLGVSAENIQKALEAFVSRSDSQKLLKIGEVTVLDDSYNANPLSVKMALDALTQLGGRRRFAVLGDMLELGASEKEQHYEIGKRVAALGFDRLIAVGPLSCETARGARDGGMTAVAEVSGPADAADILSRETAPGDVVLIKGSHAMHLETVVAHWRGDADS